MRKLQWLVVAIVVAATVGIVLLLSEFGSRTSQNVPEMAKISYQFLLITVVGGVVVFLLNEMQRSRAAIATELEKSRERDLLELEKRREREALLAQQLYRAYGQFYSAWKLWHYKKADNQTVVPEEFRDELIKAATLAEASMETIWINLAAELPLSAEQQRELGRLRQGFQQLREKIEADERVPWHSSDHPKYLEFKRLTAFLGTMLVSAATTSRPSTEAAYASLRQITSNEHERHWY